MTKNWLQPDWETGSTLPNVPLRHLKELGIRALILDVDGTLLSGRNVELDLAVINWINSAKKDYKIHLLSNNPSKKRISAVANQIKVPYAFSAGKPRRNSLQPSIEFFDLESSKIAIIGDRLFTDVLAGNRAGIYTVLVRPVGMNGDPANKLIQILEKGIAFLLKGIKR